MRLLFFSDLHLEAPFAWAPGEIARDRRRALRECLRAIVGLAATSGVDAVLCGGDLYEQDRFTPETVTFLRECFADLAPLPVFIAPGNHDWLGPASIYARADWTANVHVFTTAQLSPVELADGLTLWGAAHHSPANTRGFLDDFRVDRGGVHLGLFHGSELGAIVRPDQHRVPHAPFRADQIGAAGLHHALVGHFHTPRDAPDHTYPGNPEPLTFGETGERGAVVVTIDGSGQVTRQRHRVAVSQVSDVPVDLTGISHGGQVQDRVDRALAEVKGTVRVTLAGEVDPEVELDERSLRRPSQVDAWVVRRGVITYAYDLVSLAQEPTVRGEFVREVQAATDLSESDRRRVLVTGLRAFDKRRQDLEVR